MIGGVPEKRAFAAYLDKIFVLELFQMMRERGVGNAQFALNLADHQAVGMRGKEQLHDAEPRLGSHGGEHIGVSGDLFGSFFDFWAAVIFLR